MRVSSQRMEKMAGQWAHSGSTERTQESLPVNTTLIGLPGMGTIKRPTWAESPHHPRCWLSRKCGGIVHFPIEKVRTTTESSWREANHYKENIHGKREAQTGSGTCPGHTGHDDSQRCSLSVLMPKVAPVTSVGLCTVHFPWVPPQLYSLLHNRWQVAFQCLWQEPFVSPMGLSCKASSLP